MLRLFLGSWSSCLRMYSQSFLVSSVRGSGSFPITAVSAASGCTGLLKAFLGAAAFLGIGIGQLERAGLGCQAKKSTVLPRSSLERSCSWYFLSQCYPRRRSRPQRQPGVQQPVVVSIKSKAPRWVGWKRWGSFHGTSFGQRLFYISLTRWFDAIGTLHKINESA